MKVDFYSAVKVRFDNLTEKEKYITSFILTNLDDVKSDTIQELADKTNSSISSISRLVRKLGFDNFQEMRLSFYNESIKEKDGNIFPGKISPNDSVLEISKSVFQTGIHSLKSTRDILNEEHLTLAVNILEKANNCALFGLGGSSVITLNAHHRFLKSSLNCIYSADYHMQLIQSNRLTSNDCALIVSHTGKNKHLIEILNVLKENKVPIITITSNVLSPIAVESDCVLLSISEETNYQPEAISSMVSQLILVDALYILYSAKVDRNSEYFSKARDIINKTRT